MTLQSELKRRIEGLAHEFAARIVELAGEVIAEHLRGGGAAAVVARRRRQRRVKPIVAAEGARQPIPPAATPTPTPRNGSPATHAGGHGPNGNGSAAPTVRRGGELLFG
jgi:hypothetical protein